MLHLRFYCPLIASYLLNLILTTISAQDLPEYRALFEKGEYCQMISELQQYQLVLDHPNDEDFKLSLLLIKAYLETEQWGLAEQWINEIQKLNINYGKNDLWSELSLLTAQWAVKIENWPMADSIFDQLIVNIPQINDSVLVQSILIYNGLYNLELENKAKAEDYLHQANLMRLGESILLARSYNALGFLYLQYSEKQKAERYFLISKNIYERRGWISNTHYTSLLNDLSILCHNTGNLQKADSILTLSEQLQNNCTSYSTLGFIASTRGLIHYELGNYENAVSKYQESIEHFSLVNNNKEKAVSYFNLAEVQFFLGDIDEANKNYSEALKINERSLKSRNNLTRANILQGLAAISEYKMEDDLADSLYQLSLKIIDQKYGKENTFYATALNNYARFKENLGQYEVAIKLYHATETLDTILLGIHHPDYNTTLYNLARIYTKINARNQALNYYRKANNLQLNLLNNYFENFDEVSRLSYRLEVMGNFDMFFSYACSSDDQRLYGEIQDINLATKNLVLDYAKIIQNQLFANGSTEWEIFQEWLDTKRLLTKCYFKSIKDLNNSGLNIDSLEQQMGLLERKLARQESSFFKKAQEITFSQIQKKLKPGEAAIDFFNYYVTDEYGSYPDSVLYFALITTPHRRYPHLQYLCNQKELSEILASTSHYTANVAVNHRLYQMIWKPLEKHLHRVNEVHLSPEGLLHQISFASLIPDVSNNMTLIDRYTFGYYSNLRDFVLSQNKTESYKSIYLMGDVNFSSPSEGDQFYFPSLPGTHQEVLNIAALAKSEDVHVTIHTGDSASESGFYARLLAFSPQILHLATHGFFFDRDTVLTNPVVLSEQIRSSGNSLIRSGFVLSNVNAHWNRDAGLNSGEDGIVTALEVSNLDLTSTPLVVLSACETGKGAIADGEGVFGLQRALKIAGSSQLLISLWKVPDEITAQLMMHFYTLLWSGTPAVNALSQAQRKIKQAYPHPYDWSGFVLFR